MELLSESVKAALSPTQRAELERAFAQLQEDTELQHQAMTVASDRLMEDIDELVSKRMAGKQAREKERKALEEAMAALREEEREKHLDRLSAVRKEADKMEEQRDTMRQKRYKMEREIRWLKHLLELKEDEDHDKIMKTQTTRMIEEAKKWDNLTRQTEHGIITTVLTTAPKKQQLHAEFKQKVQTWMLSDTIQESAPSQTKVVPPVFRGWYLRNKWREVQSNGLFLNDGLQTFHFREEIEKLVMTNTKEGEKILRQFDKEIATLMAKVNKKATAIWSAEVEWKKKMEEKNKKEMEKRQKVEEKEKARQEAKKRREDEKLEKMRAKKVKKDAKEAEIAEKKRLKQEKKDAKETKIAEKKRAKEEKKAAKEFEIAEKKREKQEKKAAKQTLTA